MTCSCECHDEFVTNDHASSEMRASRKRASSHRRSIACTPCSNDMIANAMMTAAAQCQEVSREQTKEGLTILAAPGGLIHALHDCGHRDDVALVHAPRLSE